MAEVRKASGAKIDWNNPPKGNVICSLVLNNSAGKPTKYKAGFRTLCHLAGTDAACRKKYGVGLRVLQPPFRTSVAASAGTHDFDCVWDVYIPGVGWWEQQKFFRGRGHGAWYRHPPKFGNHVHMFTIPPNRGNSGDPVADDFKEAGLKVGKYMDGGLGTVGRLVTSSQLVDYYRHAYGLAGQHAKNSDRSWFPAKIADTIFDLGKYVRARQS